MTLNPEKCKFARNQVPFLGHIIDGDDIHADPEKVSHHRHGSTIYVWTPSIPWNGQPIV